MAANAYNVVGGANLHPLLGYRFHRRMPDANRVQARLRALSVGELANVRFALDNDSPCALFVVEQSLHSPDCSSLPMGADHCPYCGMYIRDFAALARGLLRS